MREWEIGGFYLERSFPDRGGVYYACRYDAGTGRVHRRSLRTSDLEEAKRKLAAQVVAAPAKAEDAPSPRDVMTVLVLEHYLAGHAQTIRSEGQAIRAAALVVEYLTERKLLALPVAGWTPARQLDFAAWLRERFNHSAAYIERLFHVLSAAFNDAARVKLRRDPLGREIEGSIISHAPKIEYGKAAITRDLKLPPAKSETAVPTLDEMARYLDALEQEHLRRWAIVALSTWARPEAVTTLDFETQFDPRTGLLDLNPPGRAQTNKRRARISTPLCLRSTLAQWKSTQGRSKTCSPKEPAASWLTWRGAQPASIYRALRRTGQKLDLPIRQKTFRTFMATQCRKLCPGVPREKRSLWLGHASKEGSRTTDFYEIADADYLADVALATDFIITELAFRCEKPLIPAEIQLNRADLRRIGAVPSAGNPYISGAKRGAARGDRTLDLSLTNVTPHSKSPGVSAKTAPAGTERGENRRRTK